MLGITLKSLRNQIRGLPRAYWPTPTTVVCSNYANESYIISNNVTLYLALIIALYLFVNCWVLRYTYIVYYALCTYRLKVLIYFNNLFYNYFSENI